MDEANKLARAAARRSTWTGGVAKVSDMAEVDRAFWSETSPVARLQSIWSIVEDSLALSGDHGPTPDFKELLEECVAAKVEFAIVGGR